VACEESARALWVDGRCRDRRVFGTDTRFEKSIVPVSRWPTLDLKVDRGFIYDDEHTRSGLQIDAWRARYAVGYSYSVGRTEVIRQIFTANAP